MFKFYDGLHEDSQKKYDYLLGLISCNANATSIIDAIDDLVDSFLIRHSRSLSVEKVLASGYSKSWAYVYVPLYGYQWIYIPRELYKHLKDHGVPTAQSFRNRKKDM